MSDWLDEAAVGACLGATACRFDIEVVGECASTNAELLIRANAGAPSGSVLVAERQTAGRGRQGRPWISAAGDSLTFSLLWRFPAGSSIAGLSLAVGVAIARAVERLGAGDTAATTAKTDIRLKWPNDVLKAGGKLAGTLIELASPHAAVIGIGLNLRLPDAMPDDIRATAAALDRPINPAALAHLLAELLRELRDVLDTFAVGGFAECRTEWLARHAWAGQAVQILSPPAAPLIGRASGVADDGALLLETPTGLRRILSGDVTLRLT